MPLFRRPLSTSFKRPQAELEKFGHWAGSLSMTGSGDVIMTDWSRQERDSGQVLTLLGSDQLRQS